MKKTLQVFNFSIQNAGNDAVDIFVDGEIVDAETQGMMKAFWGDETSTSFKSFRDQVKNSPAKTYNVILNTNGGHVGDAMAMHDWITQMRAEGTRVNTKGTGIVASSGTYILMAGDEPEMTANSWFLIHNVSGGVYGDVNEVENYARSLRKFNDRSRDFYASYTGMRKEDITKMMNDGQFITADEAKNKGFIKKVTSAVNFTNIIPKDQWQFSNMAVLNAYNSAVVPQQYDHKSYFDNKIDDMKKFFTDIVNGIRGVKPAEGADQTALVNQIADAMQGPLEKVGDEIESQIANALKGDAITNAVAEAVKPFENRIKQLETAKTDLEKKNGELEQEITNVKGGASVSNKDAEGPKPIGEFKK